jgi:hypothetical protein
MVDDARKALFASKYKDGEKIWSGKSFIGTLDSLRPLLAELPVSGAAVPARTYAKTINGGLEYVYGEIIYSLTGYEGYLRDKAFPVLECFIRPIFNPQSIILEFNIHYKTKQGEELTRSAEVIREGERSYLFYTDHYRPL